MSSRPKTRLVSCQHAAPYLQLLHYSFLGQIYTLLFIQTPDTVTPVRRRGRCLILSTRRNRTTAPRTCLRRSSRLPHPSHRPPPSRTLALEHVPSRFSMSGVRTATDARLQFLHSSGSSSAFQRDTSDAGSVVGLAAWVLVRAVLMRLRRPGWAFWGAFDGGGLME
ncbi:hypothetical protein K402DRAFT_243919 [Aulographum hederae CBS 113979]|uniref:Uncharacterized protein n=1 Tax=Aulographum hederae CBS 113979 TaxID=1176131 RepID=A0A6G1H9N4_9PEZI|nr:hypothetical protein K402DRAFT_243919 [Aulographum hederae CBS 113979]